ncbi:MAG: hypothetical protein WAL85_14735 [Candidatus Korobacteraceae bacterium]
MPATTLDGSWVYALNQAVADRLPFGKAIIFSLGPYASIQTKTYHPATDQLMIFGSLYLALCYAIGVIVLAKSVRLRWLLILIAFLAGGFMRIPDALLLSYVLIVAGVIYRTRLVDSSGSRSLSGDVLLLFLVAPLGLLPLVKGTLLALCGAIVCLCFAILWYQRDRRLACGCALAPLGVAVFAWLLAGQPLFALGYYAVRMQPLISGYSEAMGLPGDPFEVVAYLVAAAVILYVAYATPTKALPSRLFLTSSFLIFLFVMFKEGFVRHDAHSYIAATALVMAALILKLILQSRGSTVAFAVAVLALFYIDQGYGTSSTSTSTYYKNVKATYSDVVDGLKLRVSGNHQLQHSFDERRRAIAAQAHIPLLKGTTDIYPMDQAALLASGNAWSPRPVLQSYSAYTQSLAQLDEQHLLAPDAPDHVIFRIASVGSRFPPLDDGPSWVPLLSRYSCAGKDHDFLYLAKSWPSSLSPILLPGFEESQSIDHAFDLPPSSQPLFAQIDIHPTPLGRIVNALYKPPELTIELRTRSGLRKTYTLISGMAKAGFVISPLVESASEFGLLYGDSSYWRDRQVVSVLISTAGGKPRMWKRRYTVRLSRIQLRPQAPLAEAQDLRSPNQAACGALVE